MAVAPTPLCPPVSSTVTVKACVNEVIHVLDVKNALENATRKTGKLQRQAEALTMELLVEITSSGLQTSSRQGRQLGEQ